MHKQQEHTKHLTPEQMELYLSNKLEGQAAFEVERHLLDCEFCAEAVEGIEENHHFHGFTDDIDILKTRIENRVAEEDKKAGVNWRLVGLAATVAILVGVGSLFFWLGEPAPLKPQVAEKKVEPKKEEQKPLPLHHDTLEEINISLPQKTLVADAKPKPAVVEDAEEEVEIEADMEVETIADAAIEEPDGTTLSIEKAEFTNAQPMFSSSQTAKSLTSPISNNANAGNTLIEDTLKIFKPTDEVIAEVVKVKEEATVEAIEITPVDEVQMLSTISSAEEKTAKRKVDLAEPLTPQPLTGFKGYDEYLKNNLRYPADAKQNSITGRVVVSFKLNEYGKPTRVKVEKGLGYGCDEEAIRLIENGPLWNMESKDRVEYRVDFN